jgi:hypothetical protein
VVVARSTGGSARRVPFSISTNYQWLLGPSRSHRHRWFVESPSFVPACFQVKNHVHDEGSSAPFLCFVLNTPPDLGEQGAADGRRRHAEKWEVTIGQRWSNRMGQSVDRRDRQSPIMSVMPFNATRMGSRPSG